MNKWQLIFLSLFLPITTSCASLWQEPLEWNAQVVAPTHYDVWVSYFDMETTGVRRWRVPAGIVSCCWREPSGKGGGGYDFRPPNFFQIRWFSLAERKFYARLVELPANLEERMRRKTPVILGGSKVVPEYQDTLVVGLAPGGKIVVWIMNQARNAEEVLRTQAFEVEGEVAHFEKRLQAYESRSGEYLKKHGIPKTGW